VAKIWRCTYQAHVQGQEQLVGLHYQFDGDTGSDEPDAASVAGRVDGILNTVFRVCIPSSGVLDSLTVREELTPGSTDVPDQSILVLNQAGTGSNAGIGSQPFELCALVHRKTAAPIRGARSWVFMPSLMRSVVITNETWAAGGTELLAWQAFAAKLDDSSNYGGPLPGIMGDLNPVAYSRTRRARAQAPWTFRVILGTVDARPRWLRSRRTGA
jgi:hypothetical protein